MGVDVSMPLLQGTPISLHPELPPLSLPLGSTASALFSPPLQGSRLLRTLELGTIHTNNHIHIRMPILKPCFRVLTSGAHFLVWTKNLFFHRRTPFSPSVLLLLVLTYNSTPNRPDFGQFRRCTPCAGCS